MTFSRLYQYVFILFSLNTYSQDTSEIFISASTKGPLQAGKGVTITVTNILSGNTYKSKSLGVFSSHSYIDNLPAGRYVITKIEIPLGSIVFINQSRELTVFFDTLIIKPNSVNYLGNFQGVREVGDSAVFRMWIKSDEIPPELEKKACKKGLIPKIVNWIKHYPYKEEEFIIF